ncbi:Hypothetical protein ORPV_245 [Orpheovirus IHUMI-LCC2]|uniref:Uncharacterized protein n=1 Tax=Orpheovirus IHUMI-LCC2 TaxID=2023057 RepID=A0A2I2L3V9_9VIRU|nr:Hypothetical protein ORPV_245 [Orpheovirus IHUMI-LCC2]SNW62149.1 Hypothetical protein ORPV_245 [Orpheovirus IHUMI-LCC2]
MLSLRPADISRIVFHCSKLQSEDEINEYINEHLKTINNEYNNLILSGIRDAAIYFIKLENENAVPSEECCSNTYLDISKLMNKEVSLEDVLSDARLHGIHMMCTIIKMKEKIHLSSK